MNLNISEIEHIMLSQNQIPNQPRIVQQQQQQRQRQNPNERQTVKKNKVTYDDILSSLHMKVVDGKLQFTRTDDAAVEELSNKTTKTQPEKFSNYNKQIKMAPKTLKNHHLPIPQEYIDEKEMARPMTKQEALIQFIKARQEAERINQIKSRKLLFSTNNINVAPTFAPAMSNMFFKFK